MYAKAGSAFLSSLEDRELPPTHGLTNQWSATTFTIPLVNWQGSKSLCQPIRKAVVSFTCCEGRTKPLNGLERNSSSISRTIRGTRPTPLSCLGTTSFCASTSPRKSNCTTFPMTSRRVPIWQIKCLRKPLIFVSDSIFICRQSMPVCRKSIPNTTPPNHRKFGEAETGARDRDRGNRQNDRRQRNRN